MNEHTRPLTLSARADELEEAMMHQLTERIITKSALFNLADGKVGIGTARRPWPPIRANIFSWAPIRGCRRCRKSRR